MAIPVDAVPTSLAYPGVMPGSFGPDITPVGDLPSFNGGVRIRNAPVAASVTATLMGRRPGMAAERLGCRGAGAAVSTCWR